MFLLPNSALFLAQQVGPKIQNNLWNVLLYGVGGVRDGTIIDVADTQIGNVGGEIYWRWYANNL